MKLPAIVLGIAFGIALAAATAQAAPALDDVGLVGQSRQTFVQASIGSCTRTVRANPDNQKLSDATVTEYCTCYSDWMANRMSLAEVNRVANDPGSARSFLGTRIDTAIATCRPAGL